MGIPEYRNPITRLDYLAGLVSGDYSAGVKAVIGANRPWRGSAWIDNANIPPATTPELREDLRPAAAAIKAELELTSAPNVEFNPSNQINADTLGGFQTIGRAAFWDAQVRVLTPIGQVFNGPGNGTTIVLDALTGNITPAHLAFLSQAADAALREDNEWYSHTSPVPTTYTPPTLIEMLAELDIFDNLLPGA